MVEKIEAASRGSSRGEEEWYNSGSSLILSLGNPCLARAAPRLLQVDRADVMSSTAFSGPRIPVEIHHILFLSLVNGDISTANFRWNLVCLEMELGTQDRTMREM